MYLSISILEFTETFINFQKIKIFSCNFIKLLFEGIFVAVIPSIAVLYCVNIFFNNFGRQTILKFS